MQQPLVLILLLLQLLHRTDATYHAPVELILGVDVSLSNFLRQAALSYAVVQPNVSISIVADTPTTLITSLLAEDLDAVYVMRELNSTEQLLSAAAAEADSSGSSTSTSAVQTYPYSAIGLNMIYNIPHTLTTASLQLSLPVIAQIWTGDIRWWNATQIVELNPTLQLPSARIVVTNTAQIPGATQTAFAAALASVSTRFNTTYFNVTTQTYDFTNLTATGARVVDACPAAGCTDYTPEYTVQQTPYSIGVTTFNQAQTLGNSKAVLQNSYGTTISVSSQHLLTASTEKGVASVTSYGDCSNAQGPNTYPLCAYIYVHVLGDIVRTTCGAKTAWSQFFNWLVNSDAASTLATNADMQLAILPSTVLTNIAPLSLECNGALVSIQSTLTSNIISGATLPVNQLLEVYLSAYTSISSQPVTLYSGNQVNAIYQLLQGEVDAVVTQPDVLSIFYGDQWTTFINSTDLLFIPAYVLSLAPLYNLPDDVLALKGNFTYSPYTGGLQMNAFTLASVFMGTISQWDDAYITNDNPWLKERYDYAAANNISLNTNITLVLCCSDTSTDFSATYLLTFAMQQWLISQSFKQDAADLAYSGPYNSTSLIDFTSIIPNLPLPYVMASKESVLSDLCENTPNCISYAYQFTNEVSLTSQIGTINFDLQGRAAVAYASNEYTLPCFTVVPQPYNDINQLTAQLDNVNQPVQCQAFSQLYSVAVLSHYSDADGGVDVQRANATLNLIQWLTTNPELTAASDFVGAARVLAMPEFETKAVAALQSVTCNGQTCLITLPIHWIISAAVQDFGTTFGVIGLLAVLAVAAAISKYRHKVVIRSASHAFLLATLIGLLLLFISMILLVRPPSHATCASLAWTVDIGLFLTFAPIVARLYRIYKIFARSKLKVVRMSNNKLAAYMIAIAAVDVIILSVWTTEAPLQPTITHVYSDNGIQDTQYEQCNIVSSGVVYLVVLGVMKAVMLFYGAILSFSTRKVASLFNESSAVGWCVYNAILCVAIVIPIAIFVQAAGDSLAILELVALMWLAYTTLVLTYATKLYLCVKHDGNETAAVASKTQHGSTGSAFSFVSCNTLSKVQIGPYLRALQQHTAVVEDRYRQLHGTLPLKTGAAHKSIEDQSMLNAPLNTVRQRTRQSSAHQPARLLAAFTGRVSRSVHPSPAQNAVRLPPLTLEDRASWIDTHASYNEDPDPTNRSEVPTHREPASAKSNLPNKSKHAPKPNITEQILRTVRQLHNHFGNARTDMFLSNLTTAAESAQQQSD